jgi:hypothetical protein
VTDPEILEIVDASVSDNYSCEKCTLILNFQQSAEFRKKFRAAQNNSDLKKFDDLNCSSFRSQILQLVPQFEYLAQSILEIKDTGSERDDESFGMAYRQVKLQERKLMTLIKGYQEAMKEILEKFASENPREKQILSNMNACYLEFLKRYLPQMKIIQTNVAKLELEAVSDAYVFLHCLRWETSTHLAFAEGYKKTFHDALQYVKKEITDVCLLKLGTELTWDKIKVTLEDKIKQIRLKVIENSENALIPCKPIQPRKDFIASMLEAMLVRKVGVLLSKHFKHWQARGVQASSTSRVLEQLATKFESNYESGQKYVKLD